MRPFLVVSVGQFLSHVGAGLTTFALAITLYKASGSIGELGQLLLVGLGPTLVAAPFVGSLVEWWGPRRSVVISECGAAMCMLVLAFLLRLHVPGSWPLFVALGVSALFGALRWPALSLLIVQQVAKESYGRATGLLQLAEAAQHMLGPVLAGLLVDRLPLDGIVLLDTIAHLLAAAAVLVTPAVAGERPRARSRAGNNGISAAWRYLQTNRLMMLILVFAFTTNLTLGYLEVGYIPYVLSFASARTCGFVMSLAGVSMVAGAVTLSMWGGPRRALLGLFASSALSGVFLILAALRPSVPLLAAGACGFFFTIPYVDGCGRSFWLQRLPEEMIARVSVLRATIVTAAIPLAYVTVAPLTRGLAWAATERGLASQFVRALGDAPSPISRLFELAGLLTIGFAVAAAIGCRVYFQK